MKLKNRWMRWGVAVAVVSLIATQIPYATTKAAVAADYTNGGGDSSGNFLGIKGISNRDAIETVVVGVTVWGIYQSTVGGSGESGASGAGSSSGDGDLYGGGKKRKKKPEPSPSPSASPAADTTPATTAPATTAPANP